MKQSVKIMHNLCCHLSKRMRHWFLRMSWVAASLMVLIIRITSFLFSWLVLYMEFCFYIFRRVSFIDSNFMRSSRNFLATSRKVLSARIYKAKMGSSIWYLISIKFIEMMQRVNLASLICSWRKTSNSTTYLLEPTTWTRLSPFFRRSNNWWERRWVITR